MLFKNIIYLTSIICSIVFFKGCAREDSSFDKSKVFSEKSDSIIRAQFSKHRILDSLYYVFNSTSELNKKPEILTKILKKIPITSFDIIYKDAYKYFSENNNEEGVYSLYLSKLTVFMRQNQMDSFMLYHNKIIHWSRKNNNFEFEFLSECFRGYFFSIQREHKKADSLLLDLLRKAQKSKYYEPGPLALGFYYLGRNKSIQFELDAGMRYLKTAAELGRMAKDIYNLSDIYFRIGEIYLTEYDLNNALETYSKSMAYAKIIGDLQVLAYDYSAIGEIYANKEMKLMARQYYWKAYNLAHKINDLYQCGYVMSNLATLAQTDSNYVDALKYYASSNVFFRKLGKDEVLEHELTRNKMYEGLTYLQMGKINVAEAYLNQVKTSPVYAGDPAMQIETLIGFSEIELSKKNNDRAETYAMEAMNLSKQNEIVSTMQAGAHLLGKVNESKSDFHTALSYYKASWRMLDSITNKEQIQKFASLETEMKQNQFEAEHFKKQAELQIEKSKRENELSRQKITSTLFIIGFVIILIFAIFIYRSLQDNKKKNKIISEQKMEVELQKEIIEEKKKEVLDSITYAKKIQEAILPSIDNVKKVFPESFVLYKPKDIVAGDFYWLERSGDTILIAVGDCTGHGVPGAMVSVVCSNALNRAVKEFGLSDPGLILNKVREIVIDTFEKSGSEVRDGMDISLVALNEKQALNTIEIKWAGANNPLWYTSNGKIVEVKADKQPVGKFIHHHPFTTRSIRLKHNDTLYLITDGFADQFGGPKGKKFKYKNLKELLLQNASLGMAYQNEILSENFSAWKADLEQIDDVTILGIRL